MSTMTQHAAGTFCWCQLGTSDEQGAVKFYTSLFGWNAERLSMEGHGFTLLRLRDQAMGAIMHFESNEPGVGPSWTPFVAVESADATADAVKRNGGRILMGPMDAGKNGRQVFFTDPTSAALAVWQPGTQPGAGVVNETGAMCWNEVITDDARKAGPFYQSVFGWTTEPFGNDYTIFKKGETYAGGMMQAKPDMKLTHPYWLVYFGVDDVDASAGKVTTLGGKVQMPPTDIPDVGRIAVVTDPQSAWFGLYKPLKR